MRKRTLVGLTAALLTAGAASAVIGMHVTGSVTAIRTGLVLIVAAAVPAVTVQAAQGGATAEELRRAHNAGYAEGVMHAALGLLDPPDGGTPADTPTSYARGHLHAVTDPERKAE